MNTKTRQISLFAALCALVLFSLTSNCFATSGKEDGRESQCREAINHTAKIIMESDQYASMTPEQQKDWKKDSLDKRFISESIKKLTVEFNPKLNLSIIASQSMADLKKCVAPR